jgi:hypothetical protein
MTKTKISGAIDMKNGGCSGVPGAAPAAWARKTKLVKFMRTGKNIAAGEIGKCEMST